MRALFVDLPANEKTLGDAVGKFYDHPTDPDFQQTLEQILTGIQEYLKGTCKEGY